VSGTSAGSYSVEVSNGDGTATSAAATVTVTSQNHAPTAGTYRITVVRDQPVTISVLRLLTECSDPDGDKIYFTAADAASEQGGAILDPGGASITYVPPAGFVGTDRFSYSIEDEPFAESKGMVEVEVTAAGQ